MPVNYDDREYWHQRFQHETTFEWLVPSSTFISLIEPVLANVSRDARIWHLGFGTSDLQIYLRSRGFSNVTNVDFEPLAIERGRNLERATFGDVCMRYIDADVTKLEDNPSVLGLDHDEKFDLVIDKCTADAISCGGQDALVALARGVKACLKEHKGVWISMSYSAYRFEGLEKILPFEVDILAKVATDKGRPTDPDIYHWCYVLKPKSEQG